MRKKWDRGAEVAMNVLIEDNILRKDVLSRQGVNAPADAVLLISNKNSLLHTRSTFSVKLFRDEHKTLAPLYLEMGEIRLGFLHNLEGCGVSRESGGGNTIAEILDGIDGITPKRRREASVSKHGLCSVFKHTNVAFDFAVLGVGIRNYLLKSDASFNKVHFQGTFDKF